MQTSGFAALTKGVWGLRWRESTKRSAVLIKAISAYIERLRENRERDRDARATAIFEVGNALWYMTQVEQIKDSPWDEAYLSEIRRMFKKVIPGPFADRLETHHPAERGIYGVSIDEDPITTLDRRATEAEAKEFALDMAMRRHRDSGKVVKEIGVHRRWIWYPHLTRSAVRAWTPGGQYELICADGEDRGYVWKGGPKQPTLFVRSKGEYHQAGIITDNVVEWP